MKYFTKDLWKRTNSIDFDIRSQAELQWKTNLKNYQELYKQIEHRLPASYCLMEKKHHGFHDYKVREIILAMDRNRKYACTITLENSHQCLSIKFKNVSAYNLNISSFSECIGQELHWGYHEFDVATSGKLCFNVSFDFINELSFEFDKIVSRRVS